MADGGRPVSGRVGQPRARFYIYGPDENQGITTATMTGLDFSLFTAGGPMMWVLLAMSIVGTLLFIERLLYLHRGQIRSTAFVGGIKNILAQAPADGGAHGLRGDARARGGGREVGAPARGR